MPNQRGFTLVESIIVIAIIGMIVSVATPAFLTLNRRGATRAASHEIRSIFQLVRSRAVARAQHCGVKFTTSNGEWFYALYDDGDGDGVRNDDIKTGIDRQLTMRQRVLMQARSAFIAVPPMKIVDPDGDPLTPSSSPVQFGSSTLCSFSPLGGCTPGTIYISDRVGDVYAVRVYGATGKITLLRYNRGSKKWEAK